MRGNVRQGLASRPNRRWRACVSVRSMRSKFRENFVFISPCHCCVSDAGVRIRTRRTSLNRFAKADIIGKKQRDPGHLKGLEQRHELKIATCTAPKNGAETGDSGVRPDPSGWRTGVSAAQRADLTRRNAGHARREVTDGNVKKPPSRGWTKAGSQGVTSTTLRSIPLRIFGLELRHKHTIDSAAFSQLAKPFLVSPPKGTG